ncbi:MAG: hypothetical protein JO149_03625 [Gammaproteobacteria bacterium]|nr:hypothetical protein [Gammaproteobacteria bacterium]
MKSAQGKYNFENLDVFIYLYFDPKTFELMVPPLTPDEQENFIRQICDSVAISMPKENMPDKQFYIKRAYKQTDTRKIILLCSDGFLVDAKLTLAMHEQPFQNERINITEIEHLPPRFKLTPEIMKTLQELLPAFEEEGRKFLGTIKTIVKETHPIEKEIPRQEFVLDKSLDSVSEIHHLKKEIIEMVTSRADALKTLITQLNEIHTKLYRTILQETNVPLQESHKKKLAHYAEKTISHYCSDFIKESEFLKRKAEEIDPIHDRFEKETTEADQRILKALQSLTAFKEHIVKALYDSACEYSQTCIQQMQAAAPNAKKIIQNDFNKKFSNIAQLSDTGELTHYDEAKQRLAPLTLENLQAIISREDKDNPGLLQKCNTSWTVESPELHIVLKNLNHLHEVLRNFFSEDANHHQFAQKEMIEVIRIPFPRSFQFKFTSHTYQYKQSIDDFCKQQKELISETAKTYKKIMQIDDTLDKTNRAMADVGKATEIIKIAVHQYENLLKQRENYDELMQAAHTSDEKIEKKRQAILHLEKNMTDAVAPEFKLFTKKIEMLIQEIQIEVDMAHKTILSLRTNKAQLDSLIDHADNHLPTKETMQEVEEKTHLITEKNHAYNEQIKKINHLIERLDLYEKVINVNQLITEFDVNTTTALQVQAKGLVEKYIKEQSPDGTLSDEQRKEVSDFYAQIDNRALALEKENQSIIEMKNQLFTELNDRKSLLSDQDIEKKLASIQTKSNAVQTAKNRMTETLETIRNKL